jgi:hypothetical protein
MDTDGHDLGVTRTNSVRLGGIFQVHNPDIVGRIGEHNAIILRLAIGIGAAGRYDGRSARLLGDDPHKGSAADNGSGRHCNRSADGACQRGRAEIDLLIGLERIVIVEVDIDCHGPVLFVPLQLEVEIEMGRV